MRRWLLIICVTLVFTLSGCESDYLSEAEKDVLITKIERYTTYNEVTDALHDEKLDDVELSEYYVKDDFFNYMNKSTYNVELEYSTHFDAFSSLDYISKYLETINEFNYDNYYDLVDYNAMLKVTSIDKVITIDYYQYFEDLDIAIRQYYVLKELNQKLYMEKYSTTLDLKSDTVLLKQKLSVHEGSHIEQVEYIPKTMTYTYIYNSFENQQYFKYKGFFDDYGDYTRETVELYLHEHNSFVSYDIKDNELEDYRVKVFDNGHRVLKYDVNIFSKKDTESELTWNLLSVDGWTQLVNNSGEYQLFLSAGRTLDDYDLSIQRNGYGKIIAYKMITGDIVESDISLNNYGLESNVTLDDLEAARLAFISTYTEKVLHFGFLVSNPVNKTFIENYFISYDNNGKLNEFGNMYK